MLSFFKDQANMLYETFIRENKKANDGLQILEALSRRFHQDMDNGSNTQEILEFMKKLSTLSTFLEMTNLGIDSIIGSTKRETFIELTNSQPANLVELRVKDWIRYDLSTYHVGDKIKVLILHVVNSENNTYFVQDIAKHCNIEFSDCILDQCKLPPVGIVFAINMNTKWMRAIRVDAEPTNTNIRVRLIDRGETSSISSNTNFYSLTSEAQKMPPKGFMCRVEKVNGKEITSLDSISRMTTYDASINAICANMLELSLWSIDHDDNVKMLNDSIVECANGTSKLDGTSKLNGTSEMNETSKEKQPKNPFLDDDDDDDENSCVSGFSPQCVPPSPKAPVCVVPPIPPRKSVNTNEPLKIPRRIIQIRAPEIPEIPEIKTKPKESTESNDNVINDNTESYVTENNCETGARPKWIDTYRENQEALKDHSHFEPSGMQKLKLPSTGDIIDICPRYFQSFDEVFIHTSPSDKRFDDLYNSIIEQQEQFLPLTRLPRVNDYVLAPYSFDNSIYRAKVTKIVDAKSVMVNYIDYGNTDTVTIDKLFKWDKMCDVIPAQAICCRIANMRRFCDVTPEKRFEYLANNYTDQPCKAEILETNEVGLTINLMNSLGIDIFEEAIQYYQSNGLQAPIA